MKARCYIAYSLLGICSVKNEKRGPHFVLRVFLIRVILGGEFSAIDSIFDFGNFDRRQNKKRERKNVTHNWVCMYVTKKIQS
jgi:hypothetical protein